MYLIKKDNMRVYKFNEFITERLKQDSIDSNTLKVLKQNLLIHLKEYKEYVLRNIFIKDNQVYFENFERIEVRIILRELHNEFTKEFIDDYKIKELLEYIDDLMKNPDLKIKTNIREKFYFYFDILS
jgi:hypothetical protein|tara:strand:+ start:979 stop:1359 length:381 start_codon:yes stop_codon:yes gene_type:complete